LAADAAIYGGLAMLAQFKLFFPVFHLDAEVVLALSKVSPTPCPNLGLPLDLQSRAFVVL